MQKKIIIIINLFYFNIFFGSYVLFCIYFNTRNSHDYTAARYESISYEIKYRKSFIPPILSHKFGMYN